MLNTDDLLMAIQRIARNTFYSEKPVNVVYGTVTNESPLEITVDQKMTLSSIQLVLSRNVSDYNIILTEDGREREVTVHNRLKSGESVVLIRMLGGQQFLVVDRMAKSDTKV